ncbi:unnamed protein product, partial [Staurois parvus]
VCVCICIYVCMYVYIYIYTLCCQKYWDTPPNHWIQVFQLPPWPQVYKIKHLDMQTTSKKHLRKNGSLSRAQWIQV